VGQNRSRRLSGDASSDGQRDSFQRDRDRILYSSAFRRLAGVTQVVAPEEGHIFHNRLTHTLKVAQIGRRMAEMFLENSPDLARRYQIDPDVVEAACMAHDLGHPPYGHIAEEELDSLMAEKECGDGYEGNAQSFRIVTKLLPRDEDTPGLDLTTATLNAILKYPWLRDEHHAKKSKKWGAYQSESAEFKAVREFDAPDIPTPEAQLMTWADDIAYAVHDTEDFFRAGLIPLDRLAFPDNDESQRFLRSAGERLKHREGNIDTDALADALASLGVLFPVSPYLGNREDRFRITHQSSGLIRSYVQSTKLRPEPDAKGNVLDINPGLLIEVKLLQEMTWEYVIFNPSLACQQHGQRTIIRSLFEVYSEAVDTKKPKWHLLPPMFRSDIVGLKEKYDGKIPHEMRYRVVADIVASMTDIEAHRMFQKITGISRGSLLDPLMA